METHIVSWQTEGDVESSASFDCKVPGFSCHICSCTWVVGRKGDSKDTKEGTQWDEKESGIPKEQSQLYLVSLRGTDTQEIIPVTQVTGLRGRICSRLGAHRGQWWFFSSVDPLH